MNNEQLWTSEDVARFLQVSKSWVEHAAPKGLIPSHMIGRMRRFVPDEIKAFVLNERSRSGVSKDS